MDNLRKIVQDTLKESFKIYSPAGKPVQVGQFLYHKSPPCYRPLIQNKGLEPNVGDSYSCYVFGDGYEEAEECKPAIFATNSELKKDWFDSTYDDDIWQIDTSKIKNKWFVDNHYKNLKHVVTFENIPPQALKLIYKGTGNSIGEAKQPGKKTTTLYHGTNHPDALDGNGYVFLSTKKEFAEDYGDLIFECEVNLGKVFKTWEPENIKTLYAAGFKLTDDYITQSYGPDDEIAQFYDFENDYYPTAESFINSPFFGSDTWEAIEHSHGVTDWIFSNFDSIGILEGGVVNYYTPKKNIVSKKQIDKTKKKMPWDDDQLNEGHYTTWKKIESLEEDVEELEPKAAELVQKLSKHFKLTKIFPLGSGTQGIAYYIPNNRVLKITTDRSEVAEAHKIQGKKLKHLANIYGTYTLKGQYEGFYVIISELLDYDEDIDSAGYYLKDVLSEDHYEEEAYYKNDHRLLTRIFYGQVTEREIKQIRKDIPVYLKSDQAKVALWYLDGMIGIFKELKANNIKSSDWGTMNLGVKKNGNLAMFDLGYGGETPAATIPDIHLNEKELQEFWSANEYPEFTDGQFNPTFHNKPYPPAMNMNTAPLSNESVITSEELNKKKLPYMFPEMFDDFLIEKTEAEIREIAPTIDLNQPIKKLLKDLEENYPSIFDDFADWIFNKQKNKTTMS